MLRTWTCLSVLAVGMWLRAALPSGILDARATISSTPAAASPFDGLMLRVHSAFDAPYKCGAWGKRFPDAPVDGWKTTIDWAAEMGFTDLWLFGGVSASHYAPDYAYVVDFDRSPYPEAKVCSAEEVEAHRSRVSTICKYAHAKGLRIWSHQCNFLVPVSFVQEGSEALMHVPLGTESFSVAAHVWERKRSANIQVVAPSGRIAASLVNVQRRLKRAAVEVRDGEGGKAWAVRATKGGDWPFERVTFHVDGVPPLVQLR